MHVHVQSVGHKWPNLNYFAHGGLCLLSMDIWLPLQLPTSPPPPRHLGVRRVAFYLPIHWQHPSESLSSPGLPGCQTLSSPWADRAWVRVAAHQERKKKIMWAMDAHPVLVGVNQKGSGSHEALSSAYLPCIKINRAVCWYNRVLDCRHWVYLYCWWHKTSLYQV